MRLASAVMGEDIQYVFINNLFSPQTPQANFPSFFVLVLFSLTCNIGGFVSMSFCVRMHISRVYAFKFKSPFEYIAQIRN